MGQDYDMFQLAPAPCWAENAFLADAPPRGSELDFAFSSSAHVASRRSQAVAAAGLTSKQSSSEAAANEAFCLEDPYALFHAGRRGCEPVLPSGAQPAAHLIGPAGLHTHLALSQQHPRPLTSACVVLRVTQDAAMPIMQCVYDIRRKLHACR